MAGDTKKKDDRPKVELGVKSAHQNYLEDLLGKEHEAPQFRTFSNPGDNPAITKEGYIGTDPIYQNAADVTHEPRQADGGPDKLAEDAYVKSVEGDGNEAGSALKENFAAVSRVGSPKEVEADSDVSVDDKSDTTAPAHPKA